MIFVTVGTHEQAFNRLVQYMDEWAHEHDEEVVMQVGFSTYEPKYSTWKKMFSYQEMIKYINEARIVITHGGPSSFIMPLQVGKVPIVVPRKKQYDEHVNDHQVSFCEAVKNRLNNIILVEDEKELEATIDNYYSIVHSMTVTQQSNNSRFCAAFEKSVEELVS